MDYVAFGVGERTVVVLPGLSDGLATVRGKALALMPPYVPYIKTHRIYMFSRRNDLPVGATIDDMARDQLCALDELNIENFSVLGVSEGGMIASALALLAPERVDKLVLAVSAAGTNGIIRENIVRWLKLAERGDHAALMRDTAEKSYSEGYLKALRKTYPILGLIGRPKSYDRFRANCEAILGFDKRDEIGIISCPTLIIGGGKDKIVGAEAAQELHKLISSSEIFVYPDLGHGLYEESGDFYRRVFEFVDK
jgi:pimeloyl-ACP methyl ester carboxylesterase